MASKDNIPRLLEPLSKECNVIEGDADVESVVGEIRELLGKPDSFKTIRVRPGRAIFSFRAKSGEYLLKAFETRFMTRMSPMRFCASGQEWRAMKQAEEQGIPTSKPVGIVAGRGKPGVNYLIIRRIKDTAEFEVYLDREGERLRHELALRRNVVKAFAKFVAKMHLAGLVHRDLHLRNIMIRPPRKGEEAQFFIIDLAGEDFHGERPSEALRHENLAYLSLCFLEASPVVRRRFLREYQVAYGDQGDQQKTVRAIESQAAQRQFDLNTARIATCTEASSAIARVQRPETLLLIYRRANNADLEQLERPLAKAAPEEWSELLRQHFELRLGEGHVWKLKSPIDSTDEAATRRKVEALWGRLLELNAIHACVPSPLACLLKPPAMHVYGRVPGVLSPLVENKGHNDYGLYEELGRQLVRMHRYGCFYLPLEPNKLVEGFNVASARRGGRSLVLTAPDHIFRGAPTTLGQQAVASLGRAGRTILEYAGERPMKELVWSYARVLKLNQIDTDELLAEAHRVPTGHTLVVTRGIERTQLDGRPT